VAKKNVRGRGVIRAKTFSVYDEFPIFFNVLLTVHRDISV